jgi:IS5 family transposase
LVTIMQYTEGLPDRQVADAVRSRIDWKYALNLELTDPGFDHTVLSEFRTRLLTGSAEHLLLDPLRRVCRERKLLKARGRQRTDSTYVLAALRAGVEGTISQAVGAFGLRRGRYFGLSKNSFTTRLTATALNFVRLGEWLAGTPLAKTRKSAFVRLMEQPLAA